MTTFSFDVGFQRAILRLCMLDETFCLRAMQYLDAGHFTNEGLGWTYIQLRRYWEAYGVRCTDIPLREAVRQLYARDAERAQRYAGEVEAVIQLGMLPATQEYIKTELAEFVKRAIFASAHKESADFFNQGKHSDAYDAMARAQDKIREVTFTEVDRQWYFDELEVRQRSRIRKSLNSANDCITTGIPALDSITEGGVQRGELWSVFAYAKRGKSTWLVNQGFNATRVHKAPTLHIVLEGSGGLIASRYDARFSNELYTAVKRGAIGPAVLRDMHDEFYRLRRLLVIRTMNDWDVNVAHIKAEMTELKARGFDTEVLLVDYMDLLRSRDRVDTETQHQINSARDLKRLVNQTDVAAWSAWQAQRPTKAAHEKEHVLTAGQVADAYAKVRIVDCYGSLNATDDEMRKGTMRVFIEGHRDAPVGKLFHITNDLSRMAMITGSAMSADDLPDSNAEYTS